MPVREIDAAGWEDLNLPLGLNRYEQAVFLRRPSDFRNDIIIGRPSTNAEFDVMRKKAESFADLIRCITAACEEDCTSALDHVNYWLAPCMQSLPANHFEKTRTAWLAGAMPRSAWTRPATAGFFAGLSQALADDIAALVVVEPVALTQ
jgi:hypothetical protein